MSDDPEELGVTAGPLPAAIVRWEKTRDVAVVAAGALVAAAVAAMVSAAVQALSFQLTNPAPVSGNNVTFVGARPTVGFAERLNIFGTTGANLPVALLLVIAAAALMIAPRFDHHGTRGRRSDVVAGVVGVVAAILVLTDVIMAVTVIMHSGLFFYSYDATSRVAGVIGLLSPAVLGAGVIWCSWSLVWSRWFAGLRARAGAPAEDM